MSMEYKQTLARFEAAVRAHALKGCQHAIDQENIEKEYQLSRKLLVDKLSYRKLSRESAIHS